MSFSMPFCHLSWMNHCVKCTLCLKSVNVVSSRPLVSVVQLGKALCSLHVEILEAGGL